MQIVDICDDEVKPHCPCCGSVSFDEEGEVKPCPHLAFVGSSDTGFEPWFVQEFLTLNEDDEEEYENVVEALKGKLPGQEFVMFLLLTPAPAGLEVYVVYEVIGTDTD